MATKKPPVVRPGGKDPIGGTSLTGIMAAGVTTTRVIRPPKK